MKPTINSNAEPERLEEIVVKKDKDVEEVIKIYHESDFKYLRNKNWQDIRETYRQKKTPILTPTQIDLTLQRIIQETTTEQTNHSITGLYITYLIQKSYTAGNNNFTLNTKDTTIYALAHNLTGTKKQPIKLTINGNTNGWCGSDMKYSQLTINGNIGHWCGRNIEHSQLTINGDTGYLCGYRMKQSQLTINGNTGNDCFQYSTDSTINTNNLETYEKIKKQLAKGNKILLYDAQGNIIEQHQ